MTCIYPSEYPEIGQAEYDGPNPPFPDYRGGEGAACDRPVLLPNQTVIVLLAVEVAPFRSLITTSIE